MQRLSLVQYGAKRTTEAEFPTALLFQTPKAVRIPRELHNGRGFNANNLICSCTKHQRTVQDVAVRKNDAAFGAFGSAYTQFAPQMQEHSTDRIEV